MIFVNRNVRSKITPLTSEVENRFEVMVSKLNFNPAQMTISSTRRSLFVFDCDIFIFHMVRSCFSVVFCFKCLFLNMFCTGYTLLHGKVGIIMCYTVRPFPVCKSCVLPGRKLLLLLLLLLSLHASILLC